ncbi:cell division protein FtsX [Candidatus Koribacter versatilis Ellin345]|uniref:Cell division protein FtsX n=1 Tax=Koribacter versatilis (strain Ellin345) TaxID=204669 RepID=Q1IMS3_KORVE|nr:FtsX-like permease family protein [Candidatus Koribacter versatilis]ABF41827.1 cell division protein FtsX [Candidatus Koribacter versatilis Ellin345]
MKTYDIVDLAARNLRESVLRNSLTTIGISVGVASLVAMLSLGVGLQKLASRRLAKSGLFDTVIVSSRRDWRGMNRQEERSGPNAAESRLLDETARQELEKLPHVIEAYPDIRFVTEVRFDDKPHMGMVAGMPFSAKGGDAFDGMQGNFFSSETAAEAIVQKNFAAEILGKTDREDQIQTADLAKPLLGKELVLRYAERVNTPGAQGTDSSYSVFQREQHLKIVGVADSDPDSMRAAARARVFVPLKLAQGLHVMQIGDMRDTMRGFNSQPTYLTVSVRVENPKYVQQVEDGVKKLGFSTFSILDASKSVTQFFRVLDMFLAIFGSLALTVASIGIVNTLVMAILERRREIGIMKAIGASDADVKLLFFTEAGAMGVLGGILGVTLGWLIGAVINIGTNFYLRRQELPPEQLWVVSWWLVLFAMAISVGISLLAGLYPAGRAAKLDPVQTLRYE